MRTIWLSLAMATAPAWASTINFTDNFSPPSSEWSNSTGDWTASGGDYYPEYPSSETYAATYLPFDVEDYTLTVTVNSLGDADIFVRTNSTHSEWVDLILGGLGYGAGYRGGTTGTAIYWADSSDPNATLNEVTGVFTPGDTYTITIKAVGDTFSAYIDGSSTPVTTFTDATAGSSGEVGLGSDQPDKAAGGFGTPSSFSNFSLASVPEPADTGLLLGLAALAMAWHKVRRLRRRSAA
jgi:hypothetical protein